MSQPPLGSYLKSHRKRSGLSQRQLAKILGYRSRSVVSRHECSNSMPSLETALAYQAIFRVPVADLFPGRYHNIEKAIEMQVAALKAMLEKKSANDADAKATAQVLEWINERTCIQ